MHPQKQIEWSRICLRERDFILKVAELRKWGYSRLLEPREFHNEHKMSDMELLDLVFFVGLSFCFGLIFIASPNSSFLEWNIYLFIYFVIVCWEHVIYFLVYRRSQLKDLFESQRRHRF